MIRGLLSAMFTLGVLASALALPTTVDASAVRCRERISRESATYAQSIMKALNGCGEFVIKGKNPGPCPDATALATIAKAESRLHARIEKDCGGLDRTCGTPDDTPLSFYNWDLGSCPDLEGSGCTNTLNDCGDVSTCTQCVGEVAVNQLVGLYADEFVPSDPRSKLNSCQVRINKESLRLFRTRLTTLRKCWRGVSRERHPGPCPDPGDGKAIIKLEKAEAKLERNICKVCGGADRECGTADDLPASSIGFAAMCPDVAPLGEPSCGGPITDLQGIVDCVRCVSTFKADCVDGLAVPWGTTYPLGCNP